MLHASARSTLAVFSALPVMAALSGSPAQAADLFVAGTIGEVYKGDSETGGFEYFGGICLAPAHALAIDDANIYVGDLNGGILRLDLATGEYIGLYFVPGDATDIVVHGGDLLVSTSIGEIHRVDPVTGAVESTLVGPIGIQAMLVLGDDLYVSSAIEGSVWKGNAVSGNFEYFGCGCSGPAEGFATDGANLFAADGFGAFVRYDLATGFLMDEGSFPYGITAMVRVGEDLLLSESSGTIHRINPLDPWAGELGTLTSPITIEAMYLHPGVDPPCPADITGDGEVNVLDLIELLLCFGQSANLGCQAGDLNGDGSVNVLDLIAVLLVFGQTCP